MLFGGAGFDTLRGDGGNDVLTCGSDSDTFRYIATDDSIVGAGDIITDFDALDSNEDIFLDGLGSGVFNFLGDETNVFTGTGNTEARFNNISKVLEIDTDGDSNADMEINLVGVDIANLDNTDFTVT